MRFRSSVELVVRADDVGRINRFIQSHARTEHVFVAFGHASVIRGERIGAMQRIRVLIDAIGAGNADDPFVEDSELQEASQAALETVTYAVIRTGGDGDDVNVETERVE